MKDNNNGDDKKNLNKQGDSKKKEKDQGEETLLGLKASGHN